MGFRSAPKADIAASVLDYEIRVAIFYREGWLQAANEISGDDISAGNVRGILDGTMR